jgi:hypothetical protein
LNAFLRLNCEVDLIDGPEDFVDFAYRCLVLIREDRHIVDRRNDLVLEVDGGVEEWDFGIDGFADHLSFRSVHKCAHF